MELSFPRELSSSIINRNSVCSSFRNFFFIRSNENIDSFFRLPCLCVNNLHFHILSMIDHKVDDYIKAVSLTLHSVHEIVTHSLSYFAINPLNRQSCMIIDTPNSPA